MSASTTDPLVDVLADALGWDWPASAGVPSAEECLVDVAAAIRDRFTLERIPSDDPHLQKTQGAAARSDRTYAVHTLAYLITAKRMQERGLDGPITGDLIDVAVPMAEFLHDNGYRLTGMSPAALRASLGATDPQDHDQDVRDHTGSTPI